MRKPLNRFLVTAGVLLALYGTALAHHGTAAYDKQRSITLVGKVVRLEFVNPHAVIVLDVKGEDGKLVQWQGELTSPNNLMRVGWTRETLKPGDQITMSGFPAKSGAELVWVQKISLADGRSLAIGLGGDN